MTEKMEDLFGRDVKFPAVPADEIPNNQLALSRILAAERGVSVLYENLAKSVSGEASLLVAILKRDWEKRSRALVETGEKLLREIGHARESKEVLPSLADLERVAGWLRDEGPSRLVKGLWAFTSRSLLCSRLVPWVSDIQEVFDHFKRSLEVEDHHLALLDLLSELLEPEA